MTHREKNERVSVVFRGSVQGVGFRFTVMQLSESYAVTGTVRNEWDGSVSLVAEGNRRKLEQFIAAIQSSRLNRYIHDVDLQWSFATGQYDSFAVSF